MGEAVAIPLEKVGVETPDWEGDDMAEGEVLAYRMEATGERVRVGEKVGDWVGDLVPPCTVRVGVAMSLCVVEAYAEGVGVVVTLHVCVHTPLGVGVVVTL